MLLRKKLIWIGICCLVACLPCQSQNKLSLSFFTGTGLSCFRGNGAVSHSDYFRNGLSFPYAVDSMGNHFGRNSRANFLAGLELEYPLSDRWSVLLQTQYEQTGAALKSDSVISPSGNFRTDGSYRINYSFVSFHPQLAWNIRKGYTCFSIRSGVEYSIGVNWTDQFDFTDQTGKKFSIGHGGGEPETNDIRISMGFGLQRYKWGFSLDYIHGLRDFYISHPDKAMMRLFQFKILYRLFGGPQMINQSLK